MPLILIVCIAAVMDTTVTVMAAVLRRNRATVPVRVDEERPMNRWQ